MTMSTSEVLLKNIQKTYHLSGAESDILGVLLDEYPEELAMWEKLLGKRPADAAGLIALEYFERFIVPNLVDGKAPGEDKPYVFNKSCFVDLFGKHRSWHDLKKGLERAGRTLPREFSNFCDRMLSVVYAVPNRNDSYGERGISRDPQKTQIKRGQKTHQVRIVHNGEEQIFFHPNFTYTQCRLCWRYVPIPLNSPEKKLPLCPAHSYKSHDPEYRARARCRPAVQRHKDRLLELLVPLLQKERIKLREDRANGLEDSYRDAKFLRNLAFSKKSPLKLLYNHLYSLELPLKTDIDLLRAFNFCGGLPTNSLHNKRLEVIYAFILKHHSGCSVPLLLKDYVNAEAWLLATTHLGAKNKVTLLR